MSWIYYEEPQTSEPVEYVGIFTTIVVDEDTLSIRLHQAGKPRSVALWALRDERALLPQLLEEHLLNPACPLAVQPLKEDSQQHVLLYTFPHTEPPFVFRSSIFEAELFIEELWKTGHIDFDSIGP